MPTTIHTPSTPLATDVRVVGASLWFLPVQTRVPLKFGTETLTSVTCARVRISVESRDGRRAEGWGETPLSVQWAWPHSSPYSIRHDALRRFTESLAVEWMRFDVWGHPLELGDRFARERLSTARIRFDVGPAAGETPALPLLAALIASSPFDLALHDAFGNLLQCPTYDTYGPPLLARDLATFLEPADGSRTSFAGRFPSDYLRPKRADPLPAWHLVGGLDPLEASDLKGDEPVDGYPVLLADWIRRDGLKCLKIKLRGNDAERDFDRLVRVGQIADSEGVDWLSADFNCTVEDPDYVCRILDTLRDRFPRIYGMILYVEQPFPYELEQHPLAVQSVSARKPLFLDESAHDWRMVRFGRALGWTGVALKTCKTQSGALLAACWAQAHGMTLMVQDLTNPMLAQIPHCLLAAHVPTIRGVETNSMQYYPEASEAEAQVHPGLYQRRNGAVCLGSLRGPGFGMRVGEIRRPLPRPAVELER